MFSKLWWKKTLERAGKSAVQALILTLGPDMLGWVDMDWTVIGSGMLGAAVLSFLTSVASTSFGPDKDSPSLV